MARAEQDFAVSRLGETTIRSPLRDVRFVRDDDRILLSDRVERVRASWQAGEEPPSFELAGPARRSSSIRTTSGAASSPAGDCAPVSTTSCARSCSASTTTTAAIGGDGTLRGAHAITEEVGRRGLPIG